MSRNDPEWQAAELEVARVRDLLGEDLSDLPLETRVLARTLNKIEEADLRHDAARRSRTPARWLLAVAAIAAIAIAISMWPTQSALAAPPSLSYSLHAPEDAASAVAAPDRLAELATVAAATSAPGFGTTQRITSFGWNTPVDFTEQTAEISPFQQVVLLRPDGSVTVEEWMASSIDPSGALNLDSPHNQPAKTVDQIPPGSTPDTPASLSREPTALADQLLAEMPPDCDASTDARAACLLDQAAWLSSTFVLPSDLAEALLLSLAAEPGVRYLGTATDRVGRPVEAIAAPPTNAGLGLSVLVLLIDTATGRVVGTETVTLETDYLEIDGPTVTGFTTLTDAEWVP